MNWTDPNNSALIWSLSAKDLTLSTTGVTSFVVNVALQQKAAFSLYPVAGNITIRLRELLNAVLPDYPDLPSYNTACEVEIIATCGSESVSWSKHCIRGGVGAGNTGVGECLQGGGMVRIIPRSGKEYLSVLGYYHAAEIDETVRGVRLQCFLMDKRNDVINSGFAYDPVNFESDTGIGETTFDVSLDAILTLLPLPSGATIRDVRQMRIYVYWIVDPSGRPSSLLLGPKRYFVYSGETDRVKELCYRNSAGAFQSLYARGRRTSQMESETLSFLRDAIDRELTNDSMKKFTVDSGNLTSVEDRMAWEEFFRSRHRYVYENGVFVPIVVDEISSEMPRGILSAVTVTYHLSERYEGYIQGEGTIPNRPLDNIVL